MEVYPSFLIFLILTCWTAQPTFCKPLQPGEMEMPLNTSGVEEAETSYGGKVPTISAKVAKAEEKVDKKVNAVAQAIAQLLASMKQQS